MAARSSRSRTLAPLLALLFVGASEAVQSPEEAVRIARAAMDRGEFVRALAVVDAALQTHATREVEAAWMLRVLRGETLLSLGEYQQAKKALAFELPSRFRRGEAAVQQLIQRGFAAHLTGSPGDRAKLFDHAEATAAAHHPAALADVFRARSAVERAQKGEELARKAVAMARKHGRAAVEAKAWGTIALRLAEQERYAEAIEVGERTTQTMTRLGLVYALQNAQGNLGWSYAELGDYETATALFTRAEETARRVGAKRDRAVWLMQLGNMSFQRRDWQAASRYNREAMSVDPTARSVGLALANVGRAAIELGQFDDARGFNAQALNAKRAAGDAEAERISNIIEARIAAARDGDYRRAERLLRGVIDTAGRTSTRWEAEARLADVLARANRTDEARAFYARAIDTARVARQEIVDRDLRFSFFSTVAEIFDRYVDFLVAIGRHEEALQVTERSRAESLEEGRGAPAKIAPRAFARNNDAVILAYWLGRDRSYLWSITPDRIALHRLPPDTQIEQAVARYRAELPSARGTLQGSGARGEELYRMLVAPAAVPKGARVVIVADGELHTLNFETLVVPASPGGPRRYWIDDVVVINAGSLQLLGGAAGAPPSSPSILLVGNAPSPDPRFPSLPHAAKEIGAIARRFARRTVIEGAKATPAAYHAASPGKFDYVHFVAHGVATRKRPLDSAVILASDATRSYKLLARDVLARPLTARLVTISSCDSAGTRTYAGEGVVGLAWAFQRAGADQVIAALWKVNDEATPALMDRLYAGIRNGRDPAAALRDAKLTLVRSNGVHRHPRYWAPFVLYSGNVGRP